MTLAIRSLVGLLVLAIAVGCSGAGPTPASPGASATVSATRSTAAASGATGRSPADVLTEYVEAVSVQDVAAAARLFAPGAKVRTSGGDPFTSLDSLDQALAWVRATPPCDHRLVDVHTDGEFAFAAVAVSGSDCPAGGAEIEIPAKVVDGMIVCICTPEDDPTSP